MSTQTITAAIATATVNGGEPKATLKPMGSRLLLVISSMSGSLEVKERQRRIQAILDGLQLPENQVEIFDGADPASQVKQRRQQLFKQISSKVRQRRQTLFHLLQSGGSAHGGGGEESSSAPQPPQYPQLFLITPGGAGGAETTKYVGNAEEIFYLHDTDKLAKALGLVSLVAKTTVVTLTPAAAQQQATSTTTTWARRPSKTRRSLRAAVPRRMSEIIMNDYKGTEQYENAATKIQRVIRLWFFPAVKLREKLQKIRDETARIVDKYKRNAQKTISNTQKRYDRDRQKVEKLRIEIQRQQKKSKLLKQDIKREEKIRDSCKPASNGDDFDAAKFQKRLEKYKREVERETKHLKCWDSDIAKVRWENEKLLSCITNISELLAMRGVNWIELTKSEPTSGTNAKDGAEKKTTDQNGTNGEKKQTNNTRGDNNNKPSSGTKLAKEKGGDGQEQEQEDGASPPPPVSTVVVPNKIRRLEKSKSRLQLMMKQQTSRRSIKSVRQESKRRLLMGDADAAAAAEEVEKEAPPMYFARLNSRAKLVVN